MNLDDIEKIIREAESANIMAGHAQPHIKEIALAMLATLKQITADPFIDSDNYLKFTLKNEADHMRFWRLIRNSKTTVYVMKKKDDNNES